MVVFPVPPFWDRTAIASDIGRDYMAVAPRRRLTVRAAAGSILRVPLSPSRARSKKARKPGGPIAQLFQSSIAAGR